MTLFFKCGAVWDRVVEVWGLCGILLLKCGTVLLKCGGSVGLLLNCRTVLLKYGAMWDCVIEVWGQCGTVLLKSGGSVGLCC